MPVSRSQRIWLRQKAIEGGDLPSLHLVERGECFGSILQPNTRRLLGQGLFQCSR